MRPISTNPSMAPLSPLRAPQGFSHSGLPIDATGGTPPVEDQAVLSGASTTAVATVGKAAGGPRFNLSTLRAHAYQLTSQVAMGLAGIAGRLAPETSMMHMLSSHFLTPALGTAARLNLLDKLPATPEQLAKDLQLDGDAVNRLMRSCAVVGAVKEKDGIYNCTKLGQLLTDDHPRSLKPLAIMLTDRAHYDNWGQLEHVVKTGRPGGEKALGMSNVFEHFALHPEEAERFNNGMTAISRSVTQGLGKYYDFTGFKKIMDIGGGHGFLLSAALKAAPKAQGVLFDQAKVVAGADPVLKDQAVDDRVTKIGGSFFHNVPPGSDLYMMKNILHDWNDDECVHILSNVRKAMEDNSKLLVIEALVKDSPGAADFMNLHMMVMNGGKERSRGEFDELCARSGLKVKRTIPTEGPFHLLEIVPNGKPTDATGG